jgi:hypothetical protein
MLIPNHPEDERLSALAFGDTDATGDASLTDHVATCARCTETLNELGALRASLASLPDLRPSRPLQLVPGVVGQDGAPDRLGGWVRRLFAPMLTAGVALALVGVVGTASPAFEDMASGQDAAGEAAEIAAPASEADRALEEDGDAAGGAAPGAAEESAAADENAALQFSASPETGDTGGDGGAATLGDEASPTAEAAEAPREPAADEDVDALTSLPAERSLWPMVLFTGVALIVLAVLLRWVLAPRAA